ncbi:MAG: hypothetical protein A3K10_16440 [Bacteroidetes bacterium RIFCSPLOWO2_12_FULL_31_6]|nr:MAG: hypothetical protein A3K10_16440 [Bacteroidetes bacterium RIFCSPLOWO2_12_FULL_31_6]
MGIKSPLTGVDNCIKEVAIDAAEIISIYENQFKIDVAKYFEDINELAIYVCPQTKYRFYYPNSVSGDEFYYKQMGKLDWYYNPSRWEHGKALELISKNSKVLEVGSGPGFFLRKLKDNSINYTGLELNREAIKIASDKGIEVINEMVQAHAKNTHEKYDVVCSFQVLEHISEPLEFLISSVDCLKKGGSLIIAVPNNDSYMKDNVLNSKVLNMPPHHMGLWTLDSLKSLQKYLPIKFSEVYYEPMVGGNVDIFLYNKLYKSFGGSLIPRIIWKLRIHYLLRFIIRIFKNKLRGNSMIVRFEKI